MSATQILVADDSITIQKVFELAFESEDVEILLAGDGKAALELAIGKKPAMVIADVNMPEMDGFTLCRELGKNPVTSSIPVYLLASALDEFDEKLASEVGAAGRFDKPFKSEDMVSNVMKIISETGAAGEEKAASDDTFEDIDVPLDSIMETVSLMEEEPEEESGELGDIEEELAVSASDTTAPPVSAILDLAEAEPADDDLEEEDELAVEVLSGDETETETAADRAAISGIEDQFETAGISSGAEDNMLSADMEPQATLAGAAEMEDELSDEAKIMLKAIENADKDLIREANLAVAEASVAQGCETVITADDVEAIVEATVRRVLDEIKDGFLDSVVNEAVKKAIAESIDMEAMEKSLQASVKSAVGEMTAEMLEVFRRAVTDTTLGVAENLVKQTIDQIKDSGEE